MRPADYVALAEITRRLQPKTLINPVALHFTEGLKNRDIRFNREKFLKAAGYVENQDDDE